METDEDKLDETSTLEGCYILCARCAETVDVRMPTRCPKCGDVKAYWRQINGVMIPLKKMDLAHLTCTIKMLGEKIEGLSLDGRSPYEIALDIFYAELATREAEIKQASGIMAALTRSLGRG